MTPIVISALGTIPKGLIKGSRRLGNKRVSEDHPDCSIIKISQNTETSLAELRRLAVTQAYQFETIS